MGMVRGNGETQFGLMTKLMTNSVRFPRTWRVALCLPLAFSAGLSGASGSRAAERPPLSPTALAVTPDGATIFIACATADLVATFDPATGKMVRTTAVPASPSGLAISGDGFRLYVTCAAPASVVCIMDTVTGKLVGRLPAGHTAMSPVLSPDGKTLHVCNRFDNTVSFLDLIGGKEMGRVTVPREPVAAAVTPDGRRLLVANHLQAGRADTDFVAASISVVDTATRTVMKEIRLPNGSGLLRDVRISPDGRHAVVTHQLSRFHLPTTQVERGWINTNAVTLIDLRAMQFINTVLLDNIDAGAANPWAAASDLLTHHGRKEGKSGTKKSPWRVKTERM